MSAERIIVKNVVTQSPYKRNQIPVKIFDPETRQYKETGETRQQRKPQGVNETLKFIANRQTGRFVTGLEETVPNPFKDMTVLELRGKYNLDDAWAEYLPSIVAAEEISRQIQLEVLDGADPGTYTPVMAKTLRNSESVFRMDNSQNDATFIERFELILYEGTNVFSNDTSRGRLAIQLLKNHRYVAPTKEVVNPSTHRWYIAQFDEDEMEVSKNNSSENKAIIALEEMKDKYPSARLYQAAIILDVIRGEVSDERVYTQLNRWIKGHTGTTSNTRLKKQEQIALFLQTHKLLETSLPMFLSRYLVKQALNSGALMVNGGEYIWVSQRGTPNVERWRSLDALVSFLVGEMETYDPSEKNNQSYFGTMRKDILDRGLPAVL